MTDIVKIYNPANAASLTSEQIDGLQKLDSAQIKQLADAYRNMMFPTAYLLIIDITKPVEKQLPALSTFENLYNLRERNGQKKYVAFNFKGAYKPKNISPTQARRPVVLDLSDAELLTLPGFKTAKENFEAQTVSVVKIKKEKVMETPKPE